MILFGTTGTQNSILFVLDLLSLVFQSRLNENFETKAAAKFFAAGIDFCIAAVGDSTKGDPETVMILQELKGKSGDGDYDSHESFLFDATKSSVGNIKQVLFVSASDHAAFVATVDEGTHFGKAG